MTAIWSTRWATCVKYFSSQCTSGNGCHTVGGGYAATESILSSGIACLSSSNSTRKLLSPEGMGSILIWTPPNRGYDWSRWTTEDTKLFRHFGDFGKQWTSRTPPTHGRILKSFKWFKKRSVCFGSTWAIRPFELLGHRCGKTYFTPWLERRWASCRIFCSSRNFPLSI